MTSVIDRLRKRRAYPLSIDGASVYIRALLQSETKAGLSFKEEDESFGYVIGHGLLNEDASLVFTPTEDETPKEFGGRVLSEADMPTDTRSELTLAILKLSNGPTNEQLKALKKNSQQTKSPDSQPN